MQQIQIFADNDPDVLEQRLNAWLKKHRPHVLARRLESDGTDYAYNLVVRYCSELKTKWFYSDDIVEMQEQINKWFEEVNLKSYRNKWLWTGLSGFTFTSTGIVNSRVFYLNNYYN